MIIDRLLRPRDPAAEAWRFAKSDHGLPYGTFARFAVTVFAVMPLAATWSTPALAVYYSLLFAGFLVDRYLPLTRLFYFFIRFVAWLPAVYVFVALYWLDTSIHAVMGNTLAAWMLLYSFEATRRDYNFPMLMMGGMVLVIASLLRRDVVLLAGFTVYTIGFIPALADAAWHTVNNRHRAALADPGWRGALAALAAGCAGAVAVLLLGAALFVFVPRLDNDLLRGVGMGNIYQSSSPVFRIGGGARPLDWRPVMRVRTDAPGNYRGQVFVFYDGRIWSSIGAAAHGLLRPVSGTMVVPETWRENRLWTKIPVAQAFEVLPGFTTNLRYHLLTPVAITTDDRDLRIHPAATLTAAPRAGFRYTAYSYIPLRPRPPASAAERLDTTALGMYLQVPRRGSARVADLARQVAGEGDDARRTSRLVAWLKDNCVYDLSATAPLLGWDVLDYFLFTSRAGWCEHFASALTVMCRHAGIPARLVTGFAPGEYDPTDGSYLVRALHAHAWTEVYLVGRGWYTFDATPPGAFPAGSEPGSADDGWQSTLPNRLLKFIDADQQQLEGMVLELIPIPDLLSDAALATGGLPFVAMLVLLFVLASALLLWRRRRARAAATAALPELVRRYDAIRRALVAAGAADQPGWTPAQFAAQLLPVTVRTERQAFVRDLLIALNALTLDYYRCRFAGADPHALLVQLAELHRRTTGKTLNA